MLPISAAPPSHRASAVLIFPQICPQCSSDRTHRVIPQSPEVETFRCDDCSHEWSAPAPPPMRPVPDAALPRDWFVIKKDR